MTSRPFWQVRRRKLPLSKVRTAAPARWQGRCTRSLPPTSLQPFRRASFPSGRCSCGWLRRTPPSSRHLLIAADCTAFAYADFHNRFIRNRVTLVGCPKLDPVDYAEKLTEILKSHHIKSITLVRMEVPCCGGLENALKKALAACGKLIPWQVEIISIDGQIKE